MGMKINTNYKYFIISIFIVLTFFVYLLAMANVKLDLKYKPKELSYKNYEVKIDKSWSILVDKSQEKNRFIPEYLNKALEESGIKLKIENYHHSLDDKKTIILINDENYELLNKLPNLKNIKIPKNFKTQGYLLEIFYDQIVIVGKDSAGLFYGVLALEQLINKKTLSLPAVRIYDYPRVKIRAVHLLTDDLDGIKSELDYLAKLRINTVILSSRYFFSLDNSTYREKLKSIFDYARSLSIEPIPELQSFGVAGNILEKTPNAAEGIYVQDEPFEFKNGFAQPVLTSRINLKNPGFEGGSQAWQLGTDWNIDSESYEGNSSAKIAVRGPHLRRSSILKSKNYYIIPNSVYSLSFFAKANKLGGKYPPALRVVELGLDGKWLRQHSVYIKKNFWHRLELNFKTSPECSKIYIYANIWDGHGEAWLDNLDLKRMDNALVNVIRTDRAKIVVKNKNRSIIYNEGRDYKVIEGKMNYPYLSFNTATRIKRISSGRIKRNAKVLISYDYSIKMVPFAPWSVPYCPSEPQTYEVMSKVCKDIIDYLHPKFLSIGHDEIRGLNRDSRCKKRNLTNAQLLAYDINTLYNIIKNLDPNIKVLMWDDMLNPWHNGGDEDYQVQFGGVKGKTSYMINLIPKDIILMVWWYDERDWLNKMKNSPRYFESKGFTCLVAGWNNKENIRKWIKIVDDYNNVIGIIAVTWDGFENNLEGIEYTAEMAW